MKEIPPIATENCLACGLPKQSNKRFCSSLCYDTWRISCTKKRPPTVITTALFWEKIQRKSIDDCWNWTAQLSKQGYGLFGCRLYGKDRSHKAHRVSFYLNFGVLIPGLFILHHCNNPSCCNPSHLYPGTQQQNTNDAIATGRHARGEAQKKNHKLTTADIIKIRTLRGQGVFYRKIASMFNISVGVAFRIISGESWSHVSYDATPSRVIGLLASRNADGKTAYLPQNYPVSA